MDDFDFSYDYLCWKMSYNDPRIHMIYEDFCQILSFRMGSMVIINFTSLERNTKSNSSYGLNSTSFVPLSRFNHLCVSFCYLHASFCLYAK